MVEVEGNIVAVLYTQRIGFLEVNGSEVTGCFLFFWMGTLWGALNYSIQFVANDLNSKELFRPLTHRSS